jgi:hypothetical protein
MAKINDSENEGISWNVIENKRPKLHRGGISWNVYEK